MNIIHFISSLMLSTHCKTLKCTKINLGRSLQAFLVVIAYMLPVMLLQGLGMAIGGIVIGFMRAWQVALVVLSVIPLILMVFALFVAVLIGGARIKLKAYSAADGLAHEALFAMRTVASLTSEERFRNAYIGKLSQATQRSMQVCL